MLSNIADLSPPRKRPRRAALAALSTLANLVLTPQQAAQSAEPRKRPRTRSALSPTRSLLPSAPLPHGELGSHASPSEPLMRSPKLRRSVSPRTSAIPTAPGTTTSQTYRLHRLPATEESVGIALSIADRMKIDRPHMAAKLLKLLPYDAKMTRHWGDSVKSGQTAVWTLPLAKDGLHGVDMGGILWLEISRRGSAQSTNKDRPDTIGAIEVLWVDPSCRKFGLGSLLVQGVLTRHPEVTTWTAFASQAARDVGLSAFWRKN